MISNRFSPRSTILASLLALAGGAVGADQVVGRYHVLAREAVMFNHDADDVLYAIVEDEYAFGADHRFATTELPGTWRLTRLGADSINHYVVDCTAGAQAFMNRANDEKVKVRSYGFKRVVGGPSGLEGQLRGSMKVRGNGVKWHLTLFGPFSGVRA